MSFGTPYSEFLLKKLKEGFGYVIYNPIMAMEYSAMFTFKL